MICGDLIITSTAEGIFNKGAISVDKIGLVKLLIWINKILTKNFREVVVFLSLIITLWYNFILILWRGIQ